MSNLREAGNEPCPRDNLQIGPADARGRRSIFIPETAWANEPMPRLPRGSGRGARPNSPSAAAATATGVAVIEQPGAAPGAANRNVCFLPGPLPGQPSTFLGQSTAGGPFGATTLAELGFGEPASRSGTPDALMAPGAISEPSGMTPEEQDAWHETLRRMREERDRAAEEERKLAQERAWRDEQRRLADEAKASKAARLARRTPEEIAYDEALERRAKAEARVEEDWTDCLKKAVANNEECLKKAEKAWHDCRDSAAKDSLACDAACLLTGPLFLDCLAVCVANWARMRANCDKAYLDAKLECGNALVKAKDECSDEFIKTLRRIREDHPVPPKPASHDY